MAVVSAQVFALLLGIFSSLSQGKLTSYITVHDRRKYFVSEQPTSPDFLECGGAYDSDVKGLAIHLKLYRDQDYSTHTVTMTESGSVPAWPHQREYTYSCSDDRLVNGGGAPISSGSCKFGVLRMSMEFSGRYDCEVQSAGTGHLESSSSEVLLEIYDQEILVDGSQSQDPSSGRVDEGSPLSFSCDVNRQADISSLTIQWRRNGVEVHNQKPPDLVTPFVFTIPKATPADAGRYECVVISQSQGDLVIDTLEANNPVVVNYSPRMAFFAPPSFRETNVAGVPEIHVPRGETFLLNCTIRAYPYLYNGTISLNNHTIVDNQRIENEYVEMTKTIRDPSSEDDGVYCCEASNEMGRQRQCLIVSVYTPMNISFFGVNEKEQGCLLNGTEAVLKCKAVGSPTPNVLILSPNGTVVGRSLKDHAEAEYSFPTTFTKEGSFLCHISNDIEQAITREYKFCTKKPDSSKKTLLIESIAGAGGGFLVVFILIVALIVYSKRRPRDPEEDLLVSSPSRPTAGEQIKIIAPIICYDWVDIFRVIKPSFEGGDSFLRSVERRERQGGETDSAIFCLKKWIEQNPSANLLLAVCEAAEEANKRHLSENIAARFQDSALVGRYRALTMSSDFSSLRAETTTDTS